MKDLVRTKDYCAYCIELSEIWNNLKKNLLTQEYPKAKPVSLLKQFLTLQPSALEMDIRSKESEFKFNDQLAAIEARIELLLTEYHRSQYFTLFEFESLEVHPDLRSSFFGWCYQKMHDSITIH